MVQLRSCGADMNCKGENMMDCRYCDLRSQRRYMMHIKRQNDEMIILEDGKTEYLQLIQEPICRMSTISAIFKGFAATIVAGISLISYSSINIWILVLSFLPVLSFAVLDIYYLQMERKFRYLFDQVRMDKHEIDFSMKLTGDSKEIIAARARVWDCIKSPSIWLFYPLMLLILAIVLFLKGTNKI